MDELFQAAVACPLMADVPLQDLGLDVSRRLKNDVPQPPLVVRFDVLDDMNVFVVDGVVVSLRKALYRFGLVVAVGEEIGLIADVLDDGSPASKLCLEIKVCPTRLRVAPEQLLRDRVDPLSERLHVFAAVCEPSCRREIAGKRKEIFADVLSPLLCLGRGERAPEFFDRIVAGEIEIFFLLAHPYTGFYKHIVDGCFIKFSAPSVLKALSVSGSVLRLLLPKGIVDMKVMRAIDMERAHEVNIVLIEVRRFEERAERVFDKSDALLGRVDLVRFLLVEGYVAVPIEARSG